MLKMKRIIQKILSVTFLFFSSFSQLYAVVAGSSESVSIQSHALFPAADTDNEMRGFGWFKNGFTLENAATNCSFNSIYPVSGSLD